jgi:hypothetical protein
VLVGNLLTRLFGVAGVLRKVRAACELLGIVEADEDEPELSANPYE